MKQTPETIVMLNFVCDDIQKIARAVRDKNIYTMVMPYTVTAERVNQEKPVGLIVCKDKTAPARDAELAKFKALNIPLVELEISDEASKTAAVEKAVDFCLNTCKCSGSWTMENFLEEAIKDIREQVGNETVVLGLSGGVDSSVVAALIHKAIGKQLTCVFVNHGLLRKNEAESVQEIFARNFDMNLVYVDASDRFPYDFGAVHSVRAVTFVITVSFREEQAPPLPRLSRILHVPPRRAVRLGKEKCRRFHDARIDGNVGVFV